MSKVAEHFNNVAGDYTSDRSTGWLGRIVSRERAAALRLLDVRESDRVLDSGCGCGDYACLVKDLGGNPFGIDISQRMIDILRGRGVDGRVADLECFDLGERFDKAICAGALEFVRDPSAVLQNLKNHLKPDGSVVWVFPRKGSGGLVYRLYHLSHGIRVRLFGASDVRRLAEGAGLRVDRIVTASWISGVARLVNPK